MDDARLEVVGTPGAQPLPTDGAEFTIGRLKTNHLSLPGSEISRVHAAIRRDEDGRYTLRDCGSRFGTFLNEKRVTERVLADGDRIRLGERGGPELVFLHHSREERQPDHATTRTIGGFRQLAVLLDGLRALGSGHVLESGESLVVFSDGISEAQDAAGEEYGDERILAVVQRHAANTPGEIVEQLFLNVRQFCGPSPQADDMTVLVIRYD